MKNVILVTSILVLFATASQSQSNILIGQTKPKTIILKVNEQYKSFCYQEYINDVQLETFFSSIKAIKIEKKFPNHRSPVKKYDKYGNKLVDLSLIYEVKYASNDISVEKIFNYLNSLDIVEYAEPYYIPELLYTPDDPAVPSQYYLDKIQAYSAWDISQGDSNIVVGITDTGMDFNRSDLAENVYYNDNDPTNSIDDDNDGFIDNNKGWDTGENDANPQWNENNIPGRIPHGVSVASLACSRTDNGLDMAGPGFRTKFLPVKISNENGVLTGAYEGLVYAADHGCSIINCSWGGVFGHFFGQDVVNYATFNKNALVIAACGNNDLNIDFYPASYENVLSVAATDPDDYKWVPVSPSVSGSNYGYNIDISAPGKTVYCAEYNSNEDPIFVNGQGTSFAAPIVAGCAGIIKAHYDTLNALQIGEVIRVTADNIDTIAFNAPYAELLGAGRINLFRALTDTLPPSIRFSNIKFNNNESSTNFSAGDTITITGKYTNYLTKSSPNCTATITTTSSVVQIIQNINNIGTIATMDTANNESNPFVIRLLQGVDYDEKITIKITYTDTNYYAFEYFDFKVNSSIVNIDTNNITTTLTSTGKIAYENYYPVNGIGFIYKDNYEMMYEGGLMIASAGGKVSDCIRGSNDFSVVSSVAQTIPATVSHFDVNTVFNDNNSSTPVGVEIIQNTFAWNDSVSKDFIIIKYDIVNTGVANIDSLYAGIFADWDLVDYSINTIAFNQSNRISYTNSGDGTNLYAGIQLLSGGQLNHYAIDNIAGGNGGIDITDGFSDNEKIIALSTNRDNAGQNGNDVCDVLSSGPFTLTPGDTISIAFALHSNIHLINLLNSASVAQAIYDSLFAVGIADFNTNPYDVKIYPNPSAGNIIVEGKKITDIEITDNTGKIILRKKCYGNHTKINLTNYPAGLYLIKINSTNKTVLKKIILSPYKQN